MGGWFGESAVPAHLWYDVKRKSAGFQQLQKDVGAAFDSPDPTKIIGFATPILVHNLGSANMVRKEGSIEVWQYRFGSCVVDFFFYPVDEGASQLILKTWDMRSTIMGSRLDRSRCRDEMNLYHHKLSSNT